MNATSIPIIGHLSGLARCTDAVATYVEQHPTLTNLELHELSRLLLGALVHEPCADTAAAMLLMALLVVRDAPEAMRHDPRTISESRSCA